MTSAELKPIILYDIPCVTAGRPWSPNSMKTRYCLAYKGLPFTTVWIELFDIARLLQSKGIRQPPYTLPTIEDPNTGVLTVDSLAIAAYLDETYPQTPKVLSPAVRPLLEEVEAILALSPRGTAGTEANGNPGSVPEIDLVPRLVFVVMGADHLSQASRNHYHQLRTTRLGEPWVSTCNAYAAGRTECVRKGIESLRGAWQRVAEMYNHQGNSDGEKFSREFILGDKPCLLDFAVAGRIKFISDGLLPSEMETVRNLEGGRLDRVVESLEKYFIY